MTECKRCGIDVLYVGLCQDCVDVTGEAAPVATRVVERRLGGYLVQSSRPTRPLPRDERPAVLETVRALTVRGMSANEIALEVGVSTRTVTRMRSELGVHGKPMGHPVDHIRDQVAWRQTAVESMKANRRVA